jgi:predicted esterase
VLRGGRVALGVPLLAALGLYLVGNGPTWGAWSLATLPGLLALAGSRAERRLGRVGRGLAVGVLALSDLVYLGHRLSVTSQPARMLLCDREGCGPGPIDARVIPESESALAGLALSSAIGAIRGAERQELGRLLRRDYGALDGSPAWQGVPNAPLVGLRGASGRYLLSMPPGKTNPPCLVFLHGFGGQLSVYLRAIVTSEIGQNFAVIAPFGGPMGAFWRGDAAAEVTRLITRDLPPGVDAGNVFLMGLSNGAIGATALGIQGPLAGRLRGVVALSGIAAAGELSPSAPPLLAIAGAEDPRFPLFFIEHQTAALTARGAQVQLEVLEGDHFLILSRQTDVMGMAYHFMTANLATQRAP